FKILAHYFKKSSLLEFLVRLRQRSKCRLESAFSDSRMADMSNADEAGPAIGVIGGSGLYEIEGFAGAEEIRVETPFGDPSDTIVQGRLAGRRVCFLPRHGRGHRLLPTELNHRANL